MYSTDDTDHPERLSVLPCLRTAAVSRRPRSDEVAAVLSVVLDDATVERLRAAAERSGVEVEQLIVHVIHVASWHPDDFLVSTPADPPRT